MIGLTNAGGGGGGGLNFSIIGGLTQPTSPKENTIWVNTSTTISSYVFAAEAPSNPAEGMVWITTGTSSGVDFNALKKNVLRVYPISAKQYISGAWVAKTAKTYHGGAWVEWINYLYNNGTISDALGGFTGYAQRFSDTSGIAATVIYNDDSIYIEVGTTNKSGAALSNNKLDVTKWKTIYIRGSISAKDAYHGCFGLQPGTSSTLPPTALTADNVSGTEAIHKIDVSSLTGEYYLCFGGHRYSGYALNCTIKEIWYE